MKIGIVTHYYKSKNYGGNLQAYALTAYLNTLGYQAEQICYDSTKYAPRKSPLQKILKLGPLGVLRGVREKIINNRNAKLFLLENQKYDLKNQQEKAFSHFNSAVIPNGKTVYTDETIGKCASDYDAFITGSDQVWNLVWYRPAYYLQFVPSDKPKISYAASMAMSSLNQKQKKLVTGLLSDYTAISVREDKAVELLTPLVKEEPKLVLDPTLLLSAEQWDEICAPCMIEEPYVLCYFLGDNKKERELAEEFAQKKGLKLITMPHACGVRAADVDFPKNGEKLFDVTPERFISLIKHANYVFTDSFHATVFSYLYKKQFFVFHRSKRKEMSSRIDSIIEMFGATDHFCKEKHQETVSYLETVADIDYSHPNPEFNMLKEVSVEFLKKALAENKE